MEVCLHQTTVAGSDYVRSLDGCSRAGIRFIELIPAMVDAFLARESVAAARRALSDFGVRAVAGGGGRGVIEPNPERAKALDALKARAALYAELGVDRMVCPCLATERYPVQEFARTADRLHEVGEAVKPYRVVAMIEFTRASTLIGTLPTALDVIRRTAHPNVRAMFDFYHFWAGLSKFEDIELLRPGELHHVHFQDTPKIPRETYDNTTREVPGDGNAPLASILLALAAKGYRGPLSVELFWPRLQKGDPVAVASEIKTKSDAVLRGANLL